MGKRRSRLTGGVATMLEQTGWIRERKFRRLLKDAGLVRNYISGDSPAGHPRNVSFVPGWAVWMCAAFRKDMPHHERVAALQARAKVIIPNEVRIAQDGLGAALTRGYDVDEIVAMLTGKEMPCR